MSTTKLALTERIFNDFGDLTHRQALQKVEKEQVYNTFGKGTRTFNFTYQEWGMYKRKARIQPKADRREAE